VPKSQLEEFGSQESAKWVRCVKASSVMLTPGSYILSSYCLLKFSLGGLQRINLSIAVFGTVSEMGGHLALAKPPLGRRVRVDQTEFTGREFTNPLTPFTLLDDGVAGTAIKLAAFLCHEKAFVSFFCDCTNHGYHILSLSY